MWCSVCNNSITGEGAKSLAEAVLQHKSLTDFCAIPLTSLRENTTTELNLASRRVGLPGVIVLGTLITSATLLTTLEYAHETQTAAQMRQRPMTFDDA